jgi:hypothetical protein
MKASLLAGFVACLSPCAFATSGNEPYFPVDISGDVVKVSKARFKTLSLAEKFCGDLGMRIAAPETAKLLAYGTAPQEHDAIEFKIDLGSKQLTGLMGWLRSDLASQQEADIFIIPLNPPGEFGHDSLASVNSALLESGVTPFKLPAICE